MNTLATFVRTETWLLLIALVLVVSYQILTGRINASGMLYHTDDQEVLSPSRVQLLLFTLVGTSFVLSKGLSNQRIRQLPSVPDTLIALYGLSNLGYLSGKAYSLLLRR